MYTSAHTKLLADRDVSHVHTPYSHCLFPAYSNTLSMCRPTVQTHALWGQPLLLSAGRTLPWGRQTEPKKDQWTQWCVCYATHQPPVLSLILILVSPDTSCRFSSLSAPLEVLWIHRLSLSVFICFVCPTQKHVQVSCRTPAVDSHCPVFKCRPERNGERASQQSHLLCAK